MAQQSKNTQSPKTTLFHRKEIGRCSIAMQHKINNLRNNKQALFNIFLSSMQPDF